MGIIAAILFAIAYIIHGNGTSTNIWFDPTSLMLLGFIALALHLLGVGATWHTRARRRR